MHYAIRLKRNGEFVKRAFTSPTGAHYTKNVASAFTARLLARAEAHLAKAQHYLPREQLEIVVL